MTEFDRSFDGGGGLRCNRDGQIDFKVSLKFCRAFFSLFAFQSFEMRILNECQCDLRSASPLISCLHPSLSSLPESFSKSLCLFSLSPVHSSSPALEPSISSFFPRFRYLFLSSYLHNFSFTRSRPKPACSTANHVPLYRGSRVVHAPPLNHPPAPPQQQAGQLFTRALFYNHPASLGHLNSSPPPSPSSSPY